MVAAAAMGGLLLYPDLFFLTSLSLSLWTN
jgi:hypothetical protein